MRFGLLVSLLLLAACARGITDSERLLMGELMGETFDADQPRMLEVGVIGMTTRQYPARPQITCRERINPPPSGPTITTRTAGAVAWTHVLTNPDWTIPNYAEGPAAKSAILKTYASLERGAGQHLAHAFHTAALAMGFTTAIHALIHDDNESARRSAAEGATIFRRYELLGLRL